MSDRTPRYWPCGHNRWPDEDECDFCSFVADQDRWKARHAERMRQTRKTGR